MRIALTGGIACGKSFVSRELNAIGLATLDADDIVHELIPADERRRLAKVVFGDPAARRALEARIHPQVKQRLAAFVAGTGWDAAARGPETADLRVAVVPLLFEAHWEGDFDAIGCVTSERATQIARMMATRGYSRAEAEARIEAQMPVEEKAAKSHYVIANDGSEEQLRASVARFADWLKKRLFGADSGSEGCDFKSLKK